MIFNGIITYVQKQYFVSIKYKDKKVCNTCHPTFNKTLEQTIAFYLTRYYTVDGYLNPNRSIIMLKGNVVRMYFAFNCSCVLETFLALNNRERVLLYHCRFATSSPNRPLFGDKSVSIIWKVVSRFEIVLYKIIW